MTFARQLAMWLVLLALLAGFAELGAALTLHAIEDTRSRFLLWDPDIAGLRAAWDEDSGWDDEIGWPSPRQAVATPRDRSGAKFNADFPDQSRACASAYGDSFIWGDDVPLQDGWIEQLSRLLGCRVSNYGVSGYGTDQALARARRLTGDTAPVAMLGIFPENIMRNVNQYRAFFGYASAPHWLKGRFVLDPSGALSWVARPPIDFAGFVALHRDPAAVIPREYFLPGTRDGPVAVRFPYTLSLVRLALMPRVWTRLTSRPTWSDLYDARHPSEALPLTVAIAEAFARDAKARGRHPLVIILPASSSFRAAAKFGVFEYAPLVQALSERSIDVLDPAPALLAALGAESPCTLYAFPAECIGHFGVAGGAKLAHIIAADLKRRGWVSP